jgi:hypothetical protein
LNDYIPHYIILQFQTLYCAFFGAHPQNIARYLIFYNKYRTAREITAGRRQAPVLPTTAPFPILNNIFTSVFVHAVPRISRPVSAVPLNKCVKAGVKLEMYVIPQFVQVKFVDVHTSPPFFVWCDNVNSCILVEITGQKSILFILCGAYGRKMFLLTLTLILTLILKY